MKVRDAMTTSVSTANPGDSIQRVASIMKSEDVGFVPIVEGDELVGVVTDRDIVVGCVAEGHDGLLQESVSHVMTPHVESVSPDDDLKQAADRMANEQIRRLVVVDNGRLVGVLSHGNLVQSANGPDAAHKATEAVTKGA